MNGYTTRLTRGNPTTTTSQDFHCHQSQFFFLFRAEEIPPTYPSQGSLDKPSLSESDGDSLDDYGEGPEFKEDGSFTKEYGDDVKTSPDEKDQSAFATFV